MIAGMITTLVMVSSPFISIATDTAKEHVQNLLNPPVEKTLDMPMTIQSYLSQYFADTPVLIEIARCESQFRQFIRDGEAIRGRVNKYDVGVMQINELYHLEKAQELGLDISTLDGNLAFAKYLYEKYGTKPWASSSKCWAPKVATEKEIAMK